MLSALALLRAVIRALGYAVLACLSPTWALAVLLKWAFGKGKRAVTIAALNGIYLVIAVATAVYVWRTHDDLRQLQLGTWRSPLLIWAWFLWSRCTEVFYAFYHDAFDKLTKAGSSSSLEWSRRVKLALNSYAELILNFALMYSLMPSLWWRQDPAPARFSDVLSYSAATITTSGGLGFNPHHVILQLLSMYEVFCGLILLVVCFTIYTSRGLGGRPTPPEVEGPENRAS